MKKFSTVLKMLTAFCAMSLSAVAVASPEIGKPAPDFVGTDSNGQTVHLSDFKGKVVVLEWSNDGCPYVRKWYKSGAMQKLQEEAAKDNIVWLTVISSGPGQEGYVSGEQANQDTQSRHATPTHVLLDPKGTIGHLYDARTTPDMYVIGADGKLAYMGGADSIASTNVNDIQKAEPYAEEAIAAVAAGKPVAHPVTRPYGCNVKYAK
jgi:peroxiredoxin